jgi:AraC-like DNA-binding protein/quercetin dioxygenase-like cupin family protein
MALLAKHLAFLAHRLGWEGMEIAQRDALNVWHVTHLRFRSDWKLPEHSHAENNEMILVIEGEIETRIRGEILRGTAGSVLVYPRGVPHEERSVGGPLHLLLVVWSERKVSPSLKPSPLISDDSRGRIRHLLEWLQEVSPTEKTTLAALLHCALVEFARGSYVPADDAISRVRRHIHQNFAQKITLADLAKRAGQSPYHFARKFHRRIGQPPMRYLRQVRVEAAQTLIITSPLPLRAVALMTGLVDEFHLSRVFRSVTGRPPSYMRHLP